ncbi:dihydropteroate synthase [Acetobacter orleanensis]|uniref:Dihydropteroate synthase n=1 Tax=Acetobacter orleanensis TaxID=104099 RepID=A0A4Y3TNQ3_9PROT|nr:dihydropteroate synthase [Acetobacter orleanensis]KXV62316.1 dihydropteroate synthase [Acetobacter orleanensis]PCD79467.1 dihydropteroate synthase [Acetobacter orleanensis]GAN69135.1 dihydropteroate synthase [Acetobacter orleanensis JCM 7639]GBR25546.1 dihydropteroate synthase [Acetobacter orleanensis NRIC 0473]GEB82600.1 dihydropteroate synthase [Acetobacter orleanensis]
MNFRRLAEPAGLLYGTAAQEAVKRGWARPLAGGPAAFSFVDLIEDQTHSGFMPVADVPAGWQDVLARLVAKPASAGMPEGPQVMGILNVTPDSFSDGGQHREADRAVQAGLTQLSEGAGVLDIGGESTRPGAAVVTPEEEWQRIGPVVQGLKQQRPDAVLSIDTRNSQVMAQALAAGADVINDVSALTHDPEALPLLATKRCGVVLMHMRGTPTTMAQHAVYEDVACDVVRELGARLITAIDGGIAPERLSVDPGLGFAKNTAQNLALLRRLPLLANLGCRVVLGVSRKRMIGEITGEQDPAGRDAGTQAASVAALPLGQSVLRVHAVAGMAQALRVWQRVHTR